MKNNFQTEQAEAAAKEGVPPVEPTAMKIQVEDVTEGVEEEE